MTFSDNGSDCVDFEPYQARLSFQDYLFPTMFFFIFVLGLIGNLSVIYIIFIKPGMRTVPNMLLVNLSLGDIVLLFGCMAFYIPSYIFSSFYGGVITCGLWTFVKFSTLGVSIFTLTFMAVDRFRAITKPLHRQALSRYESLLVMAGIWFVASLLAMPVTLSSTINHFILENCSIINICSSTLNITVINNYDTIVWIQFAVYFAVPFVVISFCYIGISLSLYAQETASTLLMNNDTKAGVSVPRRQMEARRKLSIVVLALVFIFVLCRLPSESHAIFLEHHKSSIHLWQSLGRILSILYSCVNPIILYVLSPMFRKYMFRIWFPCISRTEEDYQTMTVNNTNAVTTNVHRVVIPKCNTKDRLHPQKTVIFNFPQLKWI